MLGGRDGLVRDPGAEGGSRQRLVECLEQRPVGAEVGRERAVWPAAAVARGEPQVGRDVGAAEAVDRLLRIAHRDQPPAVVARGVRRRGRGRKQLVKKLPLQPAGVLRFVHDRQAEAAPELGHEPRPLRPTHLLPGEPQEVVEARRDPHGRLHPRDAVPHDRHRPLQPRPLLGRVFGRIEPGHDEGIAKRGRHEVGEPPLVPAVAGGRLGDHRVVDRLGDRPFEQIIVARRARLDPGHPQDAGADRMDRADRGRVELGHRPLEPPGHRQPQGGIRGEEFGVQRVAALGHRRPQEPGGRDEPAADPVAEFGSRVAGVGGDEDVPDPQRLVGGQRVRHVGGHGVGLARAGARLDDRARGERILGEIEGAVCHARRYSDEPDLPVSVSVAAYRSRNLAAGDPGANTCS